MNLNLRLRRGGFHGLDNGPVPHADARYLTDLCAQVSEFEGVEEPVNSSQVRRAPGQISGTDF